MEREVRNTAGTTDHEWNRGFQRTDLVPRTRAFALDVIDLVGALPRTRAADVMGRQLLRCGTSVGANYRSSCRAKSPADFIAKMAIVEEEADEAIYWLDLLSESGTADRMTAARLMTEADELVAIVVASIKTARLKNARPKR